MKAFKHDKEVFFYSFGVGTGRVKDEADIISYYYNRHLRYIGTHPMKIFLSINLLSASVALIQKPVN